jgi:ABC-type sugar transport system ATPase subunit
MHALLSSLLMPCILYFRPHFIQFIMTILSVANVSKIIDGRRVVDEVSFTQEQSEKIAIAGETGSGKSSLVKMIGGILKAEKGTIRFNNERVFAPPDKLLPGHPGVVYLSQHFELRNNYYVHEMLSYANQLTDEESKKLYEVCQIDYLLNRKTNSGLSGGERQRIALAMLLGTKPKLLLLDEPFSNLDILHKQTIRQVVQDISSHFECNIIMVSHDPLDILSWADTLMIMKDGKLLQKATPKEVYEKPVNEYAGGLLGNFNLIKPLNEALYNMLNNDPSTNADIFIRPEWISIEQHQQANDQKMQGTIRSINYYGIYYLITVEIQGTIVTLYSMHNDFRTGDNVTIGFNIGKTWKLPG